MSNAATVAAPMVAGYVEAATATSVLGWAWIAGSPAPLAVELRLGERVVAEAMADQLRDDLARSGIGEGRHAFTLAVPEAMRTRVGELRVVARTPDGGIAPLGSPPVEDGVAERLDRLHRGLELVVGSQRVMHRNLQAALLKTGEETKPDQPGNEDLARTQAALQEQIATLELFVTRLDSQMATLAARIAPPAPPRGFALAGAFAVSGAALVVSVWGLVHAMPG